MIILILAYVIMIGLMLGSLTLMGWQMYVNFIQPGAIYYPSKAEAIEKMLDLAKVGKKDVVVDVGSGDGVILIAAAKRGARAIGYEIDPFLVKRSRKAAEEAGVGKLVEVRWKTMWDIDLAGVSVVTVYLFPHLMKRLYKIVKKRTDHPVRMVSNDYAVPDVKPDQQKGKIYLYNFSGK